jgi:diguanylate cyclase (GGDEF)-like protein
VPGPIPHHRGPTTRQCRLIRGLVPALTRARTLPDAATFLVEQVAGILQTRVALVGRTGRATPETEAAHPSPPPPGAATLDLPLGRHGNREWTLVLEGGWTGFASPCLHEVAPLLGAALASAHAHEQHRRARGLLLAAHRLGRTLTGQAPPDRMRQRMVDAAAAATRAAVASLSLHDAEANALRIVATHGYAQVLVDHVRVLPGQGVLGRVFQTRRALLARDVRDVPGLHARRARYRTPSFLAVPLLADGDVLGVLSVADRRDGQPFDRADLRALRALAVPASLGLRNHRLVDQTRVLAHAATVDPLTGLFNRRYFQTRIEEEIERARRYGVDLALLLIDIDDFKRHNDQLGHLAGDYLLRQIAEVLKRSVRVFDVCTRFGGEEFAILMPGSGSANGLIVAERIRHRVETASREDGPLPSHLRMTVSLGLAVLGADVSSQELIARADRALYRAKAEGKNRVQME